MTRGEPVARAYHTLSFISSMVLARPHASHFPGYQPSVRDNLVVAVRAYRNRLSLHTLANTDIQTHIASRRTQPKEDACDCPIWAAEQFGHSPSSAVILDVA